ncbi:MAG: class I SAM-dependent methyltransferase [Actinomycetota bacterium]|nr:class I SAM-dependent methyltransferase [Actinomycetota bacterium]
MDDYELTNQWFTSTTKPVWDSVLPLLQPTRLLEIGSYEGAATCYLVETIGSERDIEVHAIDTWKGGIEHVEDGIDMQLVEKRFNNNIETAKSKAKCNVEVVVHKESSDIALARLLALGYQEYFHFIYVDGSHQAPDVLTDAVIAFKLLSNGGIIAFDDYLWFESLPYGQDPIRSPKPAIDAFTTLFGRRLKYVHSGYQVYLQKTVP